jgi:hypothetical protein
MKTVSFDKLAQVQKTISREDALKYVYPKNPDRLMCRELTFDLETEKLIDTISSEYLPSKVMRRAFSKGYLIGVTNYICHGEHDMIEIQLTLVTLDNSFVPKDTLVAYRGNEFSASIDGLLSPGTNILLVTKNDKREFFASLFRIESKNLKFERIQASTPIPGLANDHFTILKKLDWELDFVSHQ